MRPGRGWLKSLFGCGGGWLLDLLVWGWKRPRSMPATYAPGPRSNARKYTKQFWTCQDQNTRYLVSIGRQAPHMGGLPVDIPGEELGTAWVSPVGNRAKLAYWTESTRARLRDSAEAGFEPVSVDWTLCAAERILAATCLPSVYVFWSIVSALWSLLSRIASRVSRCRSTSIRADWSFSMSTVRANWRWS